MALLSAAAHAGSSGDSGLTFARCPVEKAHAFRLLADVLHREAGADERAVTEALSRAEARAGLNGLELLEDAHLDTLLAQLAAEGGRIQQAAERIAAWRAEGAE